MNLKELEQEVRAVEPNPRDGEITNIIIPRSVFLDLMEVAKNTLRYHEERHLHSLPKCHWPMCQALHQMEDTLPTA